MRFAAVLVVVCAAFASSVSHAQVAVAVVIPEANPTLHDVAAGVIDVVDDHWQMLRPQLEPNDVAACNADAGCLQLLASAHHASHLVVVGVAGLGVRDYVVSVQLYDRSGKKLVDENTVKTASASPLDDGRSLAGSLMRAPQMPAMAETKATTLDAGPSLLSLTGAGLVGVGVVVGFASASAFLGLSAERAAGYDREGLVTGSVVFASAAVGLAAAGAACVIVDGLD